MKEYKVWAFARSAASNLPALEEQLADVMREADIATLYRILRFLQNYGAVLITTETNLRYELYLTGLDARLLRRHNRKPIYYVECEER